jgi:Tfp pilus assembly protein PilO
MLVADFILFGYLPLYKTKKAIKQTKAALNLAIIRGKESSRQLPVLTNQLHQLQTMVSSYELNIPPERDLGVFLQQIANLMNELNLSEQVVAPGAEIIAKGLNCIPINMQCKGRLAQIFEFYKRLQKLERLVRLEQVKLVNDRNFTGEVTMENKAVIYYRPEEQSNKKLWDKSDGSREAGSQKI